MVDESWDFTTYAVRVDGWIETFNSGSVTVGGAATSDSKHPGIIDLVVSGTSATNYAGYRRSVTAFSFGAGRVALTSVIRLDEVPDPTDDTLVEVGFRDRNDATVQDGVFLSASSANANWQLETRDIGAGNTVTDTGIPVRQGWQVHRIHVNEDATEVYATIETATGGVETSPTVTSTIPNGSADTLGIGYYIGWLAGTPSGILSLDYVRFQQWLPDRL